MLNRLLIFFRKERSLHEHLRSIIGFYPNNLSLYKLSFVHKSSDYSQDKLNNNERLEFLGDCVLDLVVGHYLFKTFPKEDEGFLTQVKSKLVNREYLAGIARDLGLDLMMQTKIQGKANQTNIVSDAVEALIGAIYLDKGYSHAEAFIKRSILKDFNHIKKLVDTETDYKSRLIEWGQKNKVSLEIKSEEVIESGMATYFIAKISCNQQEVSKGTGSSKKRAEQSAAQDAYSKLAP